MLGAANIVESIPAHDGNSDKGLVDRRKHPRYRWCTPITVQSVSGDTYPAITMEISESGLSALVPVQFEAGEKVILNPIGGRAAAAVLRRYVGKVCGFEFVDLSAEQLDFLRERCQRLPRFVSGLPGV
jgi:hypothetical protein